MSVSSPISVTGLARCFGVLDLENVLGLEPDT